MVIELRKINVRCMRLAIERTMSDVVGLTRTNVGYFPWSLRVGEEARKPTSASLATPANSAIALVGSDEEEPIKPTTL